jgi:hypothetical protein
LILKLKKEYDFQFKQIVLIALTLIAIAVIASPQATPDYPVLYKVLRFQEKIFSRIKQQPTTRTNYYLLLLNKRLEELNHLVRNKEFDLLYSASLRYAATAAELTDLIILNPNTPQKKTTRLLFLAHQRLLQEIVVSYPTRDSDNWKYLMDDINYLEIYTSKLPD